MAVPLRDKHVSRWTGWVRANPEWTVVLFFGGFWVPAVLLSFFYYPGKTSLSLAIAFGSSAAGAVPGFLLGVPRPGKGADPSSDGSQRYATNLEQISDWLTKIMIGAGLVQIDALATRFEVLCRAVASEYSATESASALVGLWLVFFATVGFLSAYNLTRVYLSPVFDDLERERLERELSRATNVAGALATDKARQDNREAEWQPGAAPPGNGSGTVDILVSDPHKGRFGGRPDADGYRLTARFRELLEHRGSLCEVHLRVVSERADRPLQGHVTFHLHPTFQGAVARVPVRDGAAELKLDVWGGFTVGAVTEDGTRLELDLSQQPDAPRFVREL
jgi:hypothetical protein